MTTDVKKYPELKRVLEREWDDYRLRNGRISLREAAIQMRMKSPSALHSWLRGERLPKNKNIETLVNFFREGGDERKRLENEIKLAVAAKPDQALPDPLESLVNGMRKLTVGIIEYEPFSGKDSDFFNYVFDRFVAFANLSERRVFPDIVNLDEAQQRLIDGTLDVAIGVLRTPDRALRMRFFKSPIRIPVNAVMLKSGRERASLEEVRDALSKKIKETKPDRTIYPIINEKEVGGLHVKNYLNIERNTYRAVKYEVESYADALVELNEQRSPSGGGPVPVVVADELMCLRVIEHLDTGMASSPRKRNQEGQPDLVFNVEDNYQQDKGAWMPRYRLGFAVNRSHRKWIEYLEEAFEIFLDSNAELVAGRYDELHNDIERYFLGVSQVKGKELGKIWLGLKEGPNNEVAGPWTEIISRAKQLSNPGKPSETDDAKPPQKKKGR